MTEPKNSFIFISDLDDDRTRTENAAVWHWPRHDDIYICAPSRRESEFLIYCVVKPFFVLLLVCVIISGCRATVLRDGVTTCRVIVPRDLATTHVAPPVSH